MELDIFGGDIRPETTKDGRRKKHKAVIADKHNDKTMPEVLKITNALPPTAVKWFTDEYTSFWPVDAINPKIKSNNLIDAQYGSVLRQHNTIATKYQFQYNTMDMIIIVMKLYDGVLKTETNYGVIFCELLDNIPPIRRHYVDSNPIFRNVVYTYFSAGPSYVSCDGEYRERFTHFFNIEAARKKYPSIWYEIEEYVERIKPRNRWSLYTGYFYPKMEQETRSSDVEMGVVNNSFTILILIISWFHTITDEYLHMSKSYVNPTFQDIMLKNKKNDLTFIRDLIKKYSMKSVMDFRKILANLDGSALRISTNIRCGYKMIPLNFKEVQDPLNLKYKPWREYFISAKCNVFMLNSISPSFPVILDWFYIKNSRKGLYDNKSQYDKMKHSEMAKDILHIIYEAQRGTYFAAESHSRRTTKQLKRWISSKFKRLNEKLNDSTEYLIEEIIMSEVTLAFVSEYVGRTVADIVKQSSANKTISENLGHLFKKDGFNYFNKYMFEVCYALLCCNKRLGLIHGDLHLNNVTIGQLYYPKDKKYVKNASEQYKVLYMIDKDHQYIFPNNCNFSCIIDFSRGIIDPMRWENFQDTSLPKNYVFVKNIERFTKREHESLLNLYLQMFPNKIRQREELQVVFKNHFSAVFRLLTCIDLYMFTIRLLRMFDSMTKQPYNKCISLIDKLNRMAESYIATEMNHLLNDTENYSEVILKREYPILTIIKKCFDSYNLGQDGKKNGIITDIYAIDNKLNFSITKYDEYPEIFKHVKYKSGKKLITVDKISKRRKAAAYEYEKQKLHNIEMVEYIAMRHTQKT